MAEHDVIPRIICGLDGGFKERTVAELNCSGIDPTVGVVVQFDMSGTLVASRMVKYGMVSPKSMNSKEFWPEADEANVVFPEFDLSVFADFSGLMSTPYTELPFKVMEKQGESWKAVKKGELVSKGYTDLAFRLHVRTVDPEKAKFYVLAVPVGVSMVASTYGENAGSRGFPGIKVHEGRAKLVTREESESKFGIGIEPFYNVTNGKMDDAGQIVTEGLKVPSSMDLKKAVVSLLKSGVSPNVHLKRGQFEEAVRGGKWKKKEPKTTWPDPMEEDGKDTSEEESDPKG